MGLVGVDMFDAVGAPIESFKKVFLLDISLSKRSQQILLILIVSLNMKVILESSKIFWMG